ncbi:MAG TPA: SdrD B-like domain-containing protein, partial [Humisphaera sp.]
FTSHNGGAVALAAAPAGKMVAAGGSNMDRSFVARFGSDSSATASIAGVVYNDADRDGVRDAAEPGLAGWQVYVDANNDGFLTPGEQIATTDSAGNYKLAGLVVGTYRVREVRPSGWDRTQPAGAYPLGYYDVTVTLGGAVLGKNFGNKKV